MSDGKKNEMDGCVMDLDEAVRQVWDRCGSGVCTCGLSGECRLLDRSLRSETFLLWPGANVCNTEEKF